MKIDADEKRLLESVERGEWKSAGGGKRERTRYFHYAKAALRKERLPYQTQISSLLIGRYFRPCGEHHCQCSVRIRRQVPGPAQDDARPLVGFGGELASVNRGEWTGVARFPAVRVRYARATLGRFLKA